MCWINVFQYADPRPSCSVVLEDDTVTLCSGMNGSKKACVSVVAETIISTSIIVIRINIQSLLLLHIYIYQKLTTTVLQVEL